MGAQIAGHLANAGLQVLLLDLPVEGNPNARAAAAMKALAKSSPPAYYVPAFSLRIKCGNFRDDLPAIAACDWVIEAVVERLDVKQELLTRVADHLAADAYLTTNTSGLSIAAIAESLPEELRSRFFGMHFFNPPRYQKLLELIPHAGTSAEAVAWGQAVAEDLLGKGSVVARDTPNFIGNRIGVFAIASALKAWGEGTYTLAEIESVTGQAAARPRSATFRTADLVGLDVLGHVAQHLTKVPDDEARAVFRLPEAVGNLIAAKRLGAKTKAGFYRKEKGVIEAVDPRTLEYAPFTPPAWPILKTLKGMGSPEKRLRAIFEDAGEAGACFRDMTLGVLLYAARRIDEITDSPVAIDRAMRWGFAWELGPFEMWDAMGFNAVCDTLEQSGEALPDWICELRNSGAGSIYGNGALARVTSARAQRTLSDMPVVEEHGAARFVDLGDGVLACQFLTKANTIGTPVLAAINEAVARVEEESRWKGLVIANEGTRFSAGADLGEMAGAVMSGDLKPVDRVIRNFQRTGERLRTAAKPVVVAIHGQTLGGGCELAMAARNVVAAAESYVGLVELGVGLVPAGGGCLRLAAWAAAKGGNRPERMMPWLEDAFKTIGMAAVAGSAYDAVGKGFLRDDAVIVLDADRRFSAARAEVLRLSTQGWRPAPMDPVFVLGEAVAARFRVMADNLVAAGQISEYDAFLANRLGWILTGGGITSPGAVPQQYMLDLERKVFLELLQQPKTLARIESILKHNKPLRN
jgi:3-hydroxyacyl-CoA dehydrogenase